MKAIVPTDEPPELFRGLSAGDLARVLADARQESIPAGTILFREGEPANRFFIIQGGRISLEAHDPAGTTVLLEEIGVGQVFGWSWLFPPFTWHFRARAVEDCRLTVLNGASLLAVAEENHSFGYPLMKRITRLLIQRLDTARQRLLEQSRTGPRI